MPAMSDSRTVIDYDEIYRLIPSEDVDEQPIRISTILIDREEYYKLLFMIAMSAIALFVVLFLCYNCLHIESERLKRKIAQRMNRQGCLWRSEYELNNMIQID